MLRKSLLRISRRWPLRSLLLMVVLRHRQLKESYVMYHTVPTRTSALFHAPTAGVSCTTMHRLEGTGLVSATPAPCALSVPLLSPLCLQIHVHQDFCIGAHSKGFQIAR